MSLIFQASDVSWQTREGIGAARIHGDGKGVAMILQAGCYQCTQQSGRQVVDAEISRVFKSVKADRLAGTGNTSNQNNAHEFDHTARRPSGCQPLPALRRSARNLQ